jgi:hypothetical protein
MIIDPSDMITLPPVIEPMVGQPFLHRTVFTLPLFNFNIYLPPSISLSKADLMKFVTLGPVPSSHYSYTWGF